MDEFLASDMEKITGVRRTRWVQWRERGWLYDPSVQVAEGHGTRNIWHRLDLYDISLFRHITEMGLPRKFAASVAENLMVPKQEEINASDSRLIEYRSYTWKSWRYLIYRRKGNKHWLSCTNRSVINLDRLVSDSAMEDSPSYYDFVFIIDLQRIKNEVDEKIEALAKTQGDR